MNKISPFSERLCQSGYFLIIASWFAPDIFGWFSEMGFLAILAGLLVLLVEKVSERKKLEASYGFTLINRIS